MKDKILKLVNASEILTLKTGSKTPKAGREQSEVNDIKNGSLIAVNGVIKWIGPANEMHEQIPSDIGNYDVHEIDCSGKTIIPGLVDPHTHLIFGGSREDEFAMRNAGSSYQEIAAAGGGIKSTVNSTQKEDDEKLIDNAKTRLDRMLSLGTTTVEGKSGYGLSTKDELRILRLQKQIDQTHPIDIVSTFLGAHTVPSGIEKEDYIKEVMGIMIPAVDRENLAEFCDVFCEKNVFTPEESELILLRGKKYNLKPKIHADQLSAYGGSEVASRVGAISADHLDYITSSGIKALKNSKTIGVLLPGCVFFLGLDRYAPARQMIDAGIPIALSTDLNPGTCYTESLHIIMTIACTRMKMSPEEALVACTINAAHAINRQDSIGSLEPGKKADIAIFDCPAHRIIPYHFGVNLCVTTIKDGEVVYTASRS